MKLTPQSSYMTWSEAVIEMKTKTGSEKREKIMKVENMNVKRKRWTDEQNIRTTFRKFHTKSKKYNSTLMCFYVL